MSVDFDLAQELRAYREKHPDEHEIVDLFVAFVSSTPDFLLRGHTAGHMTGSAFVVDRSVRETLLVHHRKLRLWVQPGGHADGNADLWAVAQQELKEETGLSQYDRANSSIFDIDRHTIPVRGEVSAHHHYDVRFLFVADRQQELILSSESIDVRWFDLETIVSGALSLQGIRTDESVQRMARKVTHIANYLSW